MIDTFRQEGIYKIGTGYFGFLVMGRDTFVLRLLKGDDNFFLYECEKKVTRIRRPLEKIAIDDLLLNAVVSYRELGENVENNITPLGNVDKLTDIFRSYNSSGNNLSEHFGNSYSEKARNLQASKNYDLGRENFSRRFDKAMPWLFWFAVAGTVGAGVGYLIEAYLRAR